MSPAGYSLASLSSKHLRFADRLISWARSGFESTGKYGKCAEPELLVRSGAAPILHPWLLVLTTKPAGMLLFYSGANTLSG